MAMILTRCNRFSPRIRFIFAIAAIHLAAITAGSFLPVRNALAQQTPASGKFLVASRELRGSGFAESVILLIQHDQNGTMGLIVNQPTDTNPAEFLPDVPGLAGRENTLYIGGPVAAWGIIMLVHSSQAPANAEHVFGDVYTSGDRGLLDELIESDKFETDVRLYAGHAGWAAGQLDAEILRGSWLVIPAQTELVFSTQPRRIWRRLIGTGDRMIVNEMREPHHRYTYNVTSPQTIPILSGHFSSAMP